MSKLNRALDILFAAITVYTLIHALTSGDARLAIWVLLAGIFWGLGIAKDKEITRLRESQARLARYVARKNRQAYAAARKDNA